MKFNKELFSFSNTFDLETWIETLNCYKLGLENGMPINLACFNLSHSYNMPLDVNIYEDLKKLINSHKLTKYIQDLNLMEGMN